MKRSLLAFLHVKDLIPEKRVPDFVKMFRLFRRHHEAVKQNYPRLATVIVFLPTRAEFKVAELRRPNNTHSSVSCCIE